MVRMLGVSQDIEGVVKARDATRSSGGAARWPAM
jgi:hypothetical protein